MAKDLPSEQRTAASRIPFERHRPACADMHSQATHQGSDRASYTAVFYLTAAFFFSATLLRSVLTLGEDAVREQALLLLAAWFILFVVEQFLSRRWPWLFGLYLLLQTALLVALLSRPASTDFFAVLFAVLSMQVVQRWPLKPACVCIVLFASLTALSIIGNYDLAEALVFALTYGAVDCFAAFYSWSARKAEEERERTEFLAGRLRAANRELRAYSDRIERLTVARERSWIARELHDSVTQTIFAMTLAARSLLLLPEGDRERVDGQLDRLTALTNGALSEMHVLVADMRPEEMMEGGLVVALQRHLASRTLADGLTIALDVEGEEPLTAAEEQGLFRIAQEALNNVAKHAGSPQASVRLRLREPFWMEVRDQGRGFDASNARGGTGMGLTSMQERAAEIGWTLEISSAPGKGTLAAGEHETRMRRGGLCDGGRRRRSVC